MIGVVVMAVVVFPSPTEDTTVFPLTYIPPLDIFGIVFRLQSSKATDTTSKSTGEDGIAGSSIMALATQSCTEFFATAHERDMVEWRERVIDGRYQLAVLDATIAPADDLGPGIDQPTKLFAKTPPAPTAPVSSSSSSNHGHKAFSGKKTVTTAASFFGSKKSGSGNPPTTTSSTTSTTKPAAATTKEPKIRSNQVAPVPVGTTSTTGNKKPLPVVHSKPVGNADDFVADLEDSDDEESAQAVVQLAAASRQTKKEQQMARRKAVQEANRQASRENEEEDGSDNEKEQYKVVGAMDAFATTAPKTATTASAGPPPPNNNNNSGAGGGGIRQRKRRKKLVEETVMVNGYLRTETKAIWEDVPTDEEEEEKNTAMTKINQTKTLVAKNSQGMKQKSLMGFFAKKK
jgi:hypothetical protein